VGITVTAGVVLVGAAVAGGVELVVAGVLLVGATVTTGVVLVGAEVATGVELTAAVVATGTEALLELVAAGTGTIVATGTAGVLGAAVPPPTTTVLGAAPVYHGAKPKLCRYSIFCHTMESQLGLVTRPPVSPEFAFQANQKKLVMGLCSASMGVPSAWTFCR